MLIELTCKQTWSAKFMDEDWLLCPRYRCEVMSSACLFLHIFKNHVSKFAQIFSTCYPWPCMAILCETAWTYSHRASRGPSAIAELLVVHSASCRVGSCTPKRNFGDNWILSPNRQCQTAVQPGTFRDWTPGNFGLDLERKIARQALLCSVELGSIKFNLEMAKIGILPWENMSTVIAKLPKSEFAHL